MSNQRLDISGQEFGNLTAVRFLDVLEPEGSVWLFACGCGEAVVYSASLVMAGRKWRCRGCYLASLRKGRAPHKSRAKPKVPREPSLQVQFKREATSWKAMLARVSPNNRAYTENYSGRGIRLEHEVWRSFAEFLKDMGPRPEGTTLERKENSEGYRPDNCVWATPKQQVSNTRVSHRIPVNGRLLTATAAAAELGISVAAVCNRVRKSGLDHTAKWINQQLEKNKNDH